jgi:hypothetical protein
MYYSTDVIGHDDVATPRRLVRTSAYIKWCILLSSVWSIIVRLTALQSYARTWLLLLISIVNINCVSATMFKTNERYKTANATRCETVYHKPEYTFHSHVRTYSSLEDHDLPFQSVSSHCITNIVFSTKHINSFSNSQKRKPQTGAHFLFLPTKEGCVSDCVSNTF